MAWHTHAQMNQMHKTLCDEYPEWCTYLSVGKTYLGNDIMMFRVGTQSGGKILYDGALHGWEKIGSELGYLWLKYILENDISWILDGCWWLMIPAVNYDADQGQRCNLNFEDCPPGGPYYGVDLNRNFVRGWNYTAPCKPYPNCYHGKNAASEPETQVMRNVFQTYKPKYYVNTHYGGGPWFGHYSSIPTSTVQPLYNRITALASELGVGCIWPFASTGVGGGAVGDAYTYGAISFLWECYNRNTSSDPNCRIGVCGNKNCCQAAIEMGKPEYAGLCGTVNPDYSYVETIVFPKSLPYFLALSEFSARYKDDEAVLNIQLL